MPHIQCAFANDTQSVAILCGQNLKPITPRAYRMRQLSSRALVRSHLYESKNARLDVGHTQQAVDANRQE